MQLSQKLLVGIISTLALSSCSQNNDQFEVLSNPQDAIIGGTEVPAGDPIQQSVVALLDSDTGELCSGSLLPNNIVLTAAHCIGNSKETMTVLFDTKLTESSESRSVDKVEISPYWDAPQDEGKNFGDIALIHFVGKVPVGYKPATFLSAKNSQLLKPGVPVVLAGYGIIDGVTHDGAGTLRTTTVKIEDSKFSPSEMTLNQQAGTGSCHGDSGGPAYLLINGKYYLWGVTSRGVKDTENNCKQYSAYTNVLFYKNWINRMITKLSKSLVQTPSSGITQ